MTEHADQAAEKIEEVLRGSGLTDRPDLYDSSIHSWRCEHPDRYGACDCFAELVADLLPIVKRAQAQAWDEGERWRRKRRDLPAVLGDPNPYLPGRTPPPPSAR